MVSLAGSLLLDQDGCKVHLIAPLPLMVGNAYVLWKLKGSSRGHPRPATHSDDSTAAHMPECWPMSLGKCSPPRGLSVPCQEQGLQGWGSACAYSTSHTHV
eukprot:2794711-Amphidinium_carterae.1